MDVPQSHINKGNNNYHSTIQRKGELTMKRFIIGFLTVATMFFCGCAPSWYTYKNVRYDTSEEALQAQRDFLSQMSRKIAPIKSPQYGKALVVLPSPDAVMARGIRGVTRDQVRDPANKAAVDFIVKTSVVHGHFMGELLANWGLFEDVQIEETLYPGKTAYEKRPSYDGVIYLKLEGDGKREICLVTPNSTEESLLFTKNAIPSDESGFRFWLNRIEEEMEQQKMAAPVSDTKTANARLKKAMETERPPADEKKSETGDFISDETGDGPVAGEQKAAVHHVGFNPFSYPGMHSTELGQDEIVAILNFPDRREGSEKGDTHIGTIYGAVYHNPLVEIHSAQPVSNDIMDAMETLFMANSFQVKKYAAGAENKQDERFLVKGQIDKLWVGCYHSAEATVEIDVEIFDTKEKKIIWTGKIESQETIDPRTMFLVPFLNKTLGNAFNKAWNKQGMGSAFEGLQKEASLKSSIQKLKGEIQAHPSDASAYLKLGIGYYDIGKYKEAIKALKHSIQIKSDNARAHYHLGLAYLVDGNKDAAIAQYEILKDLDENFARKLFTSIYE